MTMSSATPPTPTDRRRAAVFLRRAQIIALLLAVPVALRTTSPTAAAPASGWRADPAWHAGKAEWALYDAVRPIYGVERRYEASIFTNAQHMDPRTTTKAVDWEAPGNIAVFKHNVSELIPTENYTYRFLTTSFVRRDTLQPYKLVMSSQEDCGSTYKQFVQHDGRIRAEQFCYFPSSGHASDEYHVPRAVAFHDALTFTLRDYPFDDPNPPTLTIDLLPDQTDTHGTPLHPANATVKFVGKETITVPYGEVVTYHIRVDHDCDGDVNQSDYWFSADPDMRRVLVKYEGTYNVRYELKQLAWWAYWDRGNPQPEPASDQ